MKKLLSFTKKKKSCGTSDNVSALSDGYDLKDKDLGKIHKAVFQGDLAKVKPLAKKSDINQLDKENRTPLHIACATGHDEVVQFLVDSKAKLNLRDNQNRSALMKAVEGQHERCVAIMLENHADPNLADVNGNTALHLAANIPSIPTATRLLQHGAEINAQNKEGFAPLTVAIREDRIEMAEFLLKETADVNCLDHEQRSPLMLAASSGQHSMVKLLLQFDPDITLQDKKGWTADDYAQKNGHHSCCLLITEYGTKRTHRASVSRPGPYKKKRPPSIPFHDPEPGFSLGGPATDKELGTNEAGGDLEDNSLSESVSRASKSANDEWPSTEDDDDSSAGKKPLKVNLSRILASKMGEAPVLPDTSLSDAESEPLRKTSVPVDSSTVPILSKSLLHISRKAQNFTEDEKDNDRKEQDEKDSANAENKSQDSGDVRDGVPTVPKVEVGKDKKRDFRLELGLKKGEGDESSWDSESNSELSNVPHKEEPNLHSPNKEGAAPVEDSLKENVFYIPSFLRGEGGSRMADIEPRKNVGMPQGSQGEAGSDSKDNHRELPKEDNLVQEKKESSKALSVLSSHKGNVNIMDELGVGDVDDLEVSYVRGADGSDWDSASTISKRTPPGLKIPSSSGGGQKEDCGLPRTSTPKRSSSFGKSLPSTPSISAPLPQPCTTKISFQTADDGEDSDSEIEKTRGSRENSPTGNRRRLAHEPGTTDESQATEYTQSSDFEEHEEREKVDAVDGCEFSLNNLGHAGSDTEEKVGGDTPWEKRYEKLWVEVEKREVKSTFKSVTGELKERFGELFKSRHPAKNPTEDASSASSSAGEDSSDEEEEDIVRPTARARSTVLLTIPEQRESGQEDSMAESPGSSLCEETLPNCDQDVNDSFIRHKSALLTVDVEANASSQLTAAQEESEDDTDRYSKPASEDNGVALLATDSAGRLHEAGWSNAGSEEILTSEPALQHRRPDVSNGEGPEEEDMMRFYPEMAGKATGAMAAHRKSCIPHDGSEAGGSAKPGTSVCLSLVQAGRSHQEHQLVASQRAPVVQSCSGIKQGVEGKLQLELMVHWARQSGGPQASIQVNRATVPEVEEGTISDITDNEEEDRSMTTDQQKSKVQSLEDISVPDDLEELTQSSDTDDADSHTSGYRNAASFMQKLESFSLDPTTMTKMQNIFHEYERSIQKLRSRHGYLSEKVNQLEAERTSLKGLLEEVRDAKSLLERNQLEVQTELTNIKFQLKQEQENRQNAAMMYDTSKDKLKRLEEQHQFEVQDKQKVELSLRNMELEMRTLASNMKQLEEEQHETQKLLAQERTSRALQENLLNNHLRKQKEMEAENRKSISRSNETLSQLTEAGDRERELLRQVNSLQEQLASTRSDFEHSQADSSIKESTLVEENEALKEQLEDIRQDLKHSNETVTQTVFACNNQLSALKTELVKTTSQLEHERQARETLEAEAESTRSRLAAAVKEIELRLASHADTEKALLREKEEHQRQKDRLSNEITAQREAVSNLKQKLAKADANTNSMENEFHRVSAQLTEKNLLLDALLKEKDYGTTRAKELETALQAEKELSSRSVARQEAAEERLAHAQSEIMLLRQQLEEAQNQAAAKERAITEAQERFSDMLTKLRADCEERVHLLEERNKELASKAAELRELNLKFEEEKNQRENTLRQLQQELADSLKKLSMCEASLEVLTRYRNDLEEEKARLLKDVERLREKLEETEEKYLKAERHISSMKIRMDDMEKELRTSVAKLQEAVAAVVASEITTKQLEEGLQKLEIENARLEGTTKQQADKIEALQKSAKEAVVLADCSPGGGVRAHLEELVSNLQGSKISLEEQLNKEVHKQSMLSNTMQDSQVMWEEETKNRSKLGLRLTELEREKGELTNQMEIEKKKAKKIAEQKKAVDTRLEQEMKRNMDLQKEMHRQRTLLKSAKKKLQGQENGGANYSSMKSPHRRQSQTDGWMKDKVEDLQAELEKETSRRYQLEKINGELQEQLASQKGVGRNHGELERSKGHLENEVRELRRQLENVQPDQSVLDQYRREAEEKAHQEMQQKLEQVNLFLQSQAASQEALDEIKAANEANLRSQLEQKIRELEGELNRARTVQQETFSQKESTRSELERYRHLYNEEMRLRMSLTAKLERANSRLTEANSKLLSERSRSLMMGNITSGSLMGPSLDMGALATPANPGTSVGALNRNMSVGYSLPSTVSDGQDQRVEDYLAKMQRELDKNISKELRHATAELDAASARLSPVGSASRVELDPLSWATQQYLEVLKKNRRI
ncbi:ankyrin repeat domain-containing protein 26-like isoform X1 [Xiphophorus maculatus]|uniref:ankyrin repeat domain-containing protein 26-like isoform X1 n=1 Tax=Xiphophorus maculatus TaxID=8083 RepID=UPI000C6E6103|nr:ankyrin repeat domain-containing protein 26-like isoform X1 [Xiphophorus maculatus]XP_023202654.1 ankyrin repeat domain-containing protein 26-like isoform X1 [Xiphophorus maculatus]XP_023202661.1 ankyrin repeat domain-containing protein 26-like isoform X1 [Xiphophorus maculatus]